jgi:hypothetical protein
VREIIVRNQQRGSRLPGCIPRRPTPASRSDDAIISRVVLVLYLRRPFPDSSRIKVLRRGASDTAT